MPHTEMEDALNNCDRRLSAVEEILPTLATKQDLERYATKEDLRGGLAGLKNDLLVRIEALDDKIRAVADGVASHTVKLERLDTVADTVASHTVKLDVIGVALKHLIQGLDRSSNKLSSLTDRLDSNSGQLTSLTDRLERKGVI